MIALVTGAGNPRGIGAACVRALAERGATVAFTVMPGETAAGDLPGTAFTTDLSEAVAPERLMDAVTEQVGHPTRARQQRRALDARRLRGAGRGGRSTPTTPSTCARRCC